MVTKRLVWCLVAIGVSAQWSAMSYAQSNPWELDKEAIYNSGYSAGQNSGEATGQAAGYSSGYSVGYSNGSQAAYRSGYSTGYGSGKSFGFGQGSASGYGNGYKTGYGAGKTAGDAQGYNRGYSSGLSAGNANGRTTGIQECVADPQAFGITVDTVLPPPEYGETEPNDHLFAADPLIPDETFLGQSYGSDDTDWFSLPITKANQLLTINFAVPGAAPAGWLINVRDAAGNIIAAIDTSSSTTTVGEANNITYKVNLPLANTYYIEVRSNVSPVSPDPYTLAAMLQDSPLVDPGNTAGGFYDAEMEHNDNQANANALASGVTMYGLIDLSFDVVVPEGTQYVYAQGTDADWFKYTTAASEIVTLTFCAKEACGPGDWFIEVYDSAATPPTNPILAYNTDVSASTDTNPESIRFRLGANTTFYMRVKHKRLYTAACDTYAMDRDKDGLTDTPAEYCACGGGYECSLTVLNPGPPIVTTGAPDDYPVCADGSGGGADSQCNVDCLCDGFMTTIELPPNAQTGQYNFTWFGTKF